MKLTQMAFLLSALIVTTLPALQLHTTMKQKNYFNLRKVSCEHCKFKANSDIELECHNNVDQKPKLSAIEREGIEYLNDSL